MYDFFAKQASPKFALKKCSIEVSDTRSVSLQLQTANSKLQTNCQLLIIN